jgi:hypothetical protein
LICLIAGIWGASYEWHFINESADRSTRMIAAERMQLLQQDGAHTLLLAAERLHGMEGSNHVLGLVAEPAPYSVPPANLFRWKLVLLPRDIQRRPHVDASIATVDYVGLALTGRYRASDFWIRPRLLPTPISWAAKPFAIHVDWSPESGTIPSTTESADK